MAKKYNNPANEIDMASFVSGNSAESQACEKLDKTRKENVKPSKASLTTDGSQRAKQGAARGCKPGYTRHTYVLPQKMIEQVKAVAHFFSCSEVAAAEQIIQKGLDDIQKRHGKKALTLQKAQSLFD